MFLTGFVKKSSISSFSFFLLLDTFCVRRRPLPLQLSLCVCEPPFTFWRTKYWEEYRCPCIGLAFPLRFHQILFSRPSGCFSRISFRCCIARLTTTDIFCTAPANWRHRSKETLDDDGAARYLSADGHTYSVCLGRWDHHRCIPMR